MPGFVLLFVWSSIALVSGFLMFRRKKFINIGSDAEKQYAVSIIIPARNEEDNLPILLESINSQRNVDVEVIVADDGSDDNSANIAQKFEATVVDVPSADVPGKYFACHTGSRYANHDILLFMDADTFFETDDSLSKLCEQYQEQDYKGILSVQPFHETKYNYEKLSAIFNVMTVIGINIFSVFHKKQIPGTIFGPFMLTNRTDYKVSGGHLSSKGYIIEGAGLYESYTSHQLPIHYYLGKGTVRFRMYNEGVNSIIDGWKKHISSGADHTSASVMMMIMMWLSSSFVLPVFIIYTAIFNAALLFIPITIYIIGSVQFYSICKPLINIGKIGSLFFPVYKYFFFFVYSLSFYQVKIKKKIQWKGREMDYDE